jgi:hypothetical protein
MMLHTAHKLRAEVLSAVTKKKKLDMRRRVQWSFIPYKITHHVSCNGKNFQMQMFVRLNTVAVWLDQELNSITSRTGLRNIMFYFSHKVGFTLFCFSCSEISSVVLPSNLVNAYLRFRTCCLHHLSWWWTKLQCVCVCVCVCVCACVCVCLPFYMTSHPTRQW